MSEMDGQPGEPDAVDPEPSLAAVTHEFPVISDEPSDVLARPSAVTSASEPVLNESVPEPRRVSRRAVLGSAGALIVTAGTGFAVGWSRNFGRGDRFDQRHELPEAPLALVRAAQRETELIATTEAAPNDGAVAAEDISAILADHRAHANALQGLLGAYRPSRATSPQSPSPSVGGPATGTTSVDALRASETTAQLGAAEDSLALSGAAAALLASISACEATHVALLG